MKMSGMAPGRSAGEATSSANTNLATKLEDSGIPASRAKSRAVALAYLGEPLQFLPHCWVLPCRHRQLVACLPFEWKTGKPSSQSAK